MPFYALSNTFLILHIHAPFTSGSDGRKTYEDPDIVLASAVDVNIDEENGILAVKHSTRSRGPEGIGVSRVLSGVVDEHHQGTSVSQLPAFPLG